MYETQEFLCPVIAFPFPFCTCQAGEGKDYLFLFTGIIQYGQGEQVIPYGILSCLNSPDGGEEYLLGRDDIFPAVNKNDPPVRKPCIEGDGFEFNIFCFKDYGLISVQFWIAHGTTFSTIIVLAIKISIYWVSVSPSGTKSEIFLVLHIRAEDAGYFDPALLILEIFQDCTHDP